MKLFIHASSLTARKPRLELGKCDMTKSIRRMQGSKCWKKLFMAYERERFGRQGWEGINMNLTGDPDHVPVWG
jgi:hypothetical protein